MDIIEAYSQTQNKYYTPNQINQIKAQYQYINHPEIRGGLLSSSDVKDAVIDFRDFTKNHEALPSLRIQSDEIISCSHFLTDGAGVQIYRVNFDESKLSKTVQQKLTKNVYIDTLYGDPEPESGFTAYNGYSSSSAADSWAKGAYIEVSPSQTGIKQKAYTEKKFLHPAYDTQQTAVDFIDTDVDAQSW